MKNFQTRAMLIGGLGGLMSMTSFASRAEEEVFVKTFTFIDDQQGPVLALFPAFDASGSRRVLHEVRVDLKHAGWVDMIFDNDDPFGTAQVRGRMTRLWRINGPDFSAVPVMDVTTEPIPLKVDDGDAFCDDAPPDGFNVGDLLRFSESLETLRPVVDPYLGDGSENISMTLDVLLMDQDLEFIEPSDPWDLCVEQPRLSVQVTLTYVYHCLEGCESYPCDFIKRLRARCEPRGDERHVVRAKLTSNLGQGDSLVFQLNDQYPLRRLINAQGKAQAKWTIHDAGPYDVSLLECLEPVARTECQP